MTRATFLGESPDAETSNSGGIGEGVDVGEGEAFWPSRGTTVRSPSEPGRHLPCEGEGDRGAVVLVEIVMFEVVDVEEPAKEGEGVAPLIAFPKPRSDDDSDSDISSAEPPWKTRKFCFRTRVSSLPEGVVGNFPLRM